MPFRPLLVFLLVVIGNGICCAGWRDLETVTTHIKELKNELVTVRREFTRTLELQKTASNQTIADELEKSRLELEATVKTMVESLRDTEERRAHLLASMDISKPCPFCGGKLTKASKVARSNRSKNEVVWQPQTCLEIDFTDDSPICSRCWTARYLFCDRWTQVARSREAFVVPLHPLIAGIPNPPKTMGKDQWRFRRMIDGDGNRSETASLWKVNPSPEFVVELEEYARERGLKLSNEPALGEGRDISLSLEWRREGKPNAGAEQSIGEAIPGVLPR